MIIAITANFGSELGDVQMKIEFHEDGTLMWVNDDDKLHREDGPALINANGSIGWYKNGKLHRCGDKPAVATVNGTKEWWANDKQHRCGGKPAVVWESVGYREWWVDGRRN